MHDLRTCTPSQLLSQIGLRNTDTICVLGNPSRGVGIAKALTRRARKPFLVIGPAADHGSALTAALKPEWTRTIDHLGAALPSGNGAIFIPRPQNSYLELCEYFLDWSDGHFIILHLAGGLQIGPELVNLLSEQCLIFTESIQKSLRKSEAGTLTVEEFIKLMDFQIVFSPGSTSKDLVKVLPTYQYEEVINALGFNGFQSHPKNRPFFHSHLGKGITLTQTRTLNHQKPIFEEDEIKLMADDGVALIYATNTNEVFLANIV